jgi:hypothetical protein
MEFRPELDNFDHGNSQKPHERKRAEDVVGVRQGCITVFHLEKKANDGKEQVPVNNVT